MADTEPPYVVLLYIASKNGIATAVGIVKVKGMKIAIPIVPPNPGIAPITIPIGTPKSIAPMDTGFNTLKNASVIAVSIFVLYCRVITTLFPG